MSQVIGKPSVKLCEEDIFVGSSAAVAAAVTGKVQRRARIPKKKKKKTPEEAPSLTPAAATPEKIEAEKLESESHSLEPDQENELSDFEDDWKPTLAELLGSDKSSSSESEYFTDEELGEPKIKKRKLRELSSDGLSDEEDEKEKRRRRRKRTTTGKGRKCCDDGDEELFKQRLQ